ncbi:acyl-CoA dehydrogenase family protein [Novispirillum sp. DQ9]|uniref:acyl-CoA dehydrogenase family protein n=1 Tax=Novispirillum sp. DQ9 TaxID=3398612 RepID=UPI003C7E2CED
MINYQAPLDDIRFVLDHVAGTERLPGWDKDLAAEVLGHAGRFISEVIAPLDPIGDAEGAVLADGRVRMPAAFRDAYAQFRDGGWPGLSVAEDLGGQGLPHLLCASMGEMIAGACISFQMVVSLAQSAIRTIDRNGTADQKARFIPLLASGEWLASMCLTEPQAGSDLSQIKTVAVPDGDAWRITGGKIFISGGDQDMTGKVLHLVLARTGDPSLGLKGLSLFLCPSETEDGGTNGVSIVRLEEKMGMHASPTCQMAFEDARAEIIGAPGEGLMRMFTMMNLQRLEVALEATGLSEVAAQRSLAYARERRQGKGRTINRHADVRRMLLTQMAFALGLRAMTYRALVEVESAPASPLADFLTPVCKAFATESAMVAAQAAIQVHGGYGYLTEYRVEQILRDGRITLIYEGTNGIQAMTLAGRLLRHADGKGADAFAADVAEAVALGDDTALADALEAWRAATAVVRDNPAADSLADAYMRLTGLVAFGAAWARLAAAADHAPHPERIRTLAAFVRRTMLPQADLLRRLCIEGPDLSRVADAVFD